MIGDVMEINSNPSAFQAGVSGLQQAEKAVTDSSVQISRLNLEQNRQQDIGTKQDTQQAKAQEYQSNSPSLTEESVNLVVSEYQAKASTNVIRTADDMLGSLIDTKV